jgi:hypothetical protein
MGTPTWTSKMSLSKENLTKKKKEPEACRRLWLGSFVKPRFRGPVDSSRTLWASQARVAWKLGKECRF